MFTKITLTKKQYQEFSQIFIQYSDDESYMNKAQLIQAVKHFEESLVKNIETDNDSDNDLQINYDEFICLMTYFVQDENYEDQVMQACKVFDVRGIGFMTVGELIEKLNALNIPITDEICQILDHLVDDEGLIKCYQFVKSLLWKDLGYIN